MLNKDFKSFRTVKVNGWWEKEGYADIEWWERVGNNLCTTPCYQ